MFSRDNMLQHPSYCVGTNQLVENQQCFELSISAFAWMKAMTSNLNLLDQRESWHRVSVLLLRNVTSLATTSHQRDGKCTGHIPAGRHRKVRDNAHKQSAKWISKNGDFLSGQSHGWSGRVNDSRSKRLHVMLPFLHPESLLPADNNYPFTLEFHVCPFLPCVKKWFLDKIEIRTEIPVIDLQIYANDRLTTYYLFIICNHWQNKCIRLLPIYPNIPAV